MASRQLKLLILIGAALIALLPLSGCSAGYLLRAAYEQVSIMARREKIKDVIADPNTSDVDKKKLALVLEARDYAAQIGLDPKNTFIKYAKLDKDVLAWIMIASRAEAFELYTWWFPVVGRVPYKGFFDFDDAKGYGEKLAKEGYEVSVRGTSAFSTLGWFDDPILSTTLKNDEVNIAGIVIHESVHTTIWVRSKVDFNESLANFIGIIGARDFFKQRLEACLDNACLEENSKLYAEALEEESMQLEFAGMINKLYTELDGLYRSDLTKEEKLEKREEIFNRHIVPLRQKFPRLKALQKINNAEIMQFKLYLNGFDKFISAYEHSGKNLTAFVSDLVRREGELKDADDPYEKLRR